MAIKAILFGASGMVGEGVLHTILNDPNISSVLVIGRRPSGTVHEKMRELLHNNFFDLSNIESQLSGYTACYFCLGTTSLGKSEQEYYKTTYELTLHAAGTLSRLNPSMTFCYVSGEGTDSTEKGRTAWARIKGKTENDLMKLPFKAVYNFRPGFIRPIKGMKNTLRFAKPLEYLYPILKTLLPSHGTTMENIGHAMVNVTLSGYPKHILENKDIDLAAARQS
ncbi:MAG: epimerase [Bacteroidetes bacterium]|nr:epimerase [Bacteroidota bacterium]